MNSDMPTILIVDDEEPILVLLKRILEKAGYSVLQAADGAQARDRLKEQDIDLILCDVMMPGESGLDLIRFVKEKYPATGIVMVTAVEDQHTARTILDVGVYGYIVKPFDRSQIIITVGNALRLRELERKERSRREELERVVRERTAELEERNRQLTAKEMELRDQAEELREFNTALRVLLKKREEDKKELEGNILSHTKNIALPYLEQLKQSGLNTEQQSLVQVLESSLNDLTSPMAKALSSTFLELTPTELQVADLIRHGKRTKEIAEMLHLSTNTIVSHRYNIRTKLGLKKKKINLRTYLQSLSS
jgi:DNA-binding NarL/FixJ family response regulator